MIKTFTFPQISLDGHVYNIGGVLTNMPRAYLNMTALQNDIHPDPDAFHFVSYTTHTPEAPFAYTPKRHAPKNIVWPPKGLRQDVKFQAPSTAPAQHRMVDVIVHYEMYDGIPLLFKWVEVVAQSSLTEIVKASIITTEYLSLNKQWAKEDVAYGWLKLETDFPHSSQIQWGTDPSVKLMPGSAQPIVNCSFTNYFTVDVSYQIQVHHGTFLSFKVLMNYHVIRGRGVNH